MISIIIPTTKAPNVINVKFSLASSTLFSPNFLATIALPPVANIVPTPKTKKIIGYTIFDADKALAPTNLEINIPSMIVYREKHIIMITVGKVYFINDVNVILFCNVLFI